MIIGLTGRKGSGKDTAAAVFEAAGYKNLKLAGALKVMLTSLLAYQGVDPETRQRMIEGDLKEVPSTHLAGKSPRYAMQTLGTEWGRDLMDENFWVKIFQNTATHFPNVVCSDVRFPNEVHAMDATYRVVRPDAVANDHHLSEELIDSLPVTGELQNDFPTARGFQESIVDWFGAPSTGSSIS